MAHDEKKDFRVAVGCEPADRPIAPIRTDLLISPQLFYGSLCFVVKDPVTLKYFRLQPIEHFLCTQLDGTRTARDLLSLIQQQFPESALTVQEVLRFIGMLHESNLLVGEGVAHSEWLATRKTEARNHKVKELAQNFLFFKVPLFQPDKLLTLMEATLGKIIFSPITGVLCILLGLAALWQVLMNTDRLANLPFNLLSWQNLIVMYFVFIITKVFHEFGHGLAAKHFGGEVSSMGVLLFMFTPSFYCDTSDAWMIPSRSARLWINSGGIVVELVLASIATFVWLLATPDSFISQIAVNAMISCSVATLFFNANPLMRYDGYYFMADLLEIPNLMTKGKEFLGYYVKKYVFGLKPSIPPDQNRLRWLIPYAIASTVYRWIVTLGIIGILYYFCEQYGMGPIGVMLGVLYVTLTVLWPMYKSVRFVWKQRWDFTRRVAWAGAITTAGLGLLTIVAFLPWGHSIREPLVVLSQSDETLFVQTPGYLATVKRDIGDSVKKGDVIAILKDPVLENMRDRAISLRDQENQRAIIASAEHKPAVMAAAQTAIEAYNQQITLIENRVRELEVRAPADGIIVGEQPMKRFVGDYLRPGEKLCRVIRPDRLQARISLPQQQAALVKPDMKVRIRLWSDSNHAIDATVARISSTVSDQLIHPALASTIKGDVDVHTDAEGNVRSSTKRSTVIINLPSDLNLFIADGMTGRGEIEVRQTTVAGRVWRAILDSTTPDWHL